MGEGIRPLCSALVSHIQNAMSNAGLPSKRDVGILEQVRQSDTKVIKEWVGLITMYKYMMGEVNKTEPDSVVPTDRSGGNRHKLKHGKFNLNIRENFFFFLILIFL